MVQIDIRYEGDLRCSAVHRPSGATLTTDAPLDNQGRGEAFSPTDLVATALGTCMLTIMGIAAAKHGWDIAGSEVSVEKRMVADPARRIAELELVFRMRGAHDERARTTLERAALGCPVHRTLGTNVAMPFTFRWEAES